MPCHPPVNTQIDLVKMFLFCYTEMVGWSYCICVNLIVKIKVGRVFLMIERSIEYYQELVRSLAALPTEVEWIEFKVNNKDPERIAKYISGLSNAATLSDRTTAYIVWGIEDDNHKVIGTDFEYRKAKKGNMELELWLAQQINPKIGFSFHEVPFQDETGNPFHVTLIEIPCAESEPTRFGSVSYIRIGSNLKPLSEFKEKEAELWRKFDKTPIEKRMAYTEASDNDIVTLLDYPGYYRKLSWPIPGNRDKVLQDLSDEKFIYKNDGGTWDITNFGALMIASNLTKFERLSKRAVRVIRYADKSRLDGISEREFTSGYVISFEDIVAYIMAVIPQEEIMEGGIRRQKFSFPESAIRELLANTLVHQALDQYGTSPMVEIFADRIEFSNAGAPLVAIERIIDTVPLSRNENMAGFMHRCGICEERGSGYDKIIAATSANALLAPKIENQNNQFTKVTLFSRIPFELTAKEDRIRTCYMFACLAFVNSSAITNADIRSAFGLEETDKVKASRVIRDTIGANLIKPVDPSTAPRYMKYVPFWA